MVILITGARSGFGKLAAIEAKKRGHTVYAGLRDVETGGDLPEGIHRIALDVTDREQREAAVQKILAEQGRIDALVNNAGASLGGFVEQVDEDEFRRLLDVNVFGVFALTNLVLPAMRKQRSGTIVNVSSMSGRMAVPGLGVYAASKFALEGMTEALRHEVAPFGIRVVLIEPGPHKTDFLARNRVEARRAREAGNPYAAFMARMDATAAKVEARAGDPDPVARRMIDVCEGGWPALRHPMGPGSMLRILALKFGPFAVFERIFGRMLGSP